MKALSFLMLTIFVATSAHASVEARKVPNTSGIAAGEEFRLSVFHSAPSSKQIADEVAKRIRQGYHQRGMTIDSWSLKAVGLGKAIRDLAKKDGQFAGLNHRDIGKLDRIVEDRSLRETAYKMVVSGSINGADAEAVHVIFLPTETYETVLVISYDRSSEE